MVVITGAWKEMTEHIEQVVCAIQWIATERNTKQVLEFMGQNVCTETQIAGDKFSDYVDSVKKNGLNVTTEFGEVKITKGSWIIKEIDGTYSVSSDRNFEHRRAGVFIHG